MLWRCWTSGLRADSYLALIRGWEGLARQSRPGLARAGYLVITGYKVCQGERERERERGREREGKSEMLKSATFWWEDKNTVILERIYLSFVCLWLV